MPAPSYASADLPACDSPDVIARVASKAAHPSIRNWDAAVLIGQVDRVRETRTNIAGRSLIDRRYCRGVALVTGHAGSPDGDPDWAALARCGLTLVIYMGVTRAADIALALQRAGMSAQTPVAVVCRAHLPLQRQAVCTLATVPATLMDDDMGSPAVLVVGDVVQATPLWRQLINESAASGADVPQRAATAV